MLESDTSRTIESETPLGGKPLLTVLQLKQQVHSSTAREATGDLPDGRRCVIQQGNILSVDDLWDCWISLGQKKRGELVHWAAASLQELVTTGQVHYGINILEMS